MGANRFSISTPSGELCGSVYGKGPRVLALHGGPGMSYDYLQDAIAKLATGYEVAIFQQRGLSPSTEQGEFTIAEAVADVEAVMDGLGWRTAYVMGHSWGGHLAFHAAIAMPDRLLGVLSVDPLGAVGDGGAEAFEAEMLARVPAVDRERARLLDEADSAGELTVDEVVEGFSLFWPSYFAHPASAPPMPRVRISHSASRGLFADQQVRLPELESALPSIAVPFGVLVGELSPMPPSAGIETARRIPGAWWHVEPGAGHFVWHERPGCLVAAMDRLVGDA
jgi:pimeloyl-ACP methyl ester carboxylesterase